MKHKHPTDNKVKNHPKFLKARKNSDHPKQKLCKLTEALELISMDLRTSTVTITKERIQSLIDDIQATQKVYGERGREFKQNFPNPIL